MLRRHFAVRKEPIANFLVSSCGGKRFGDFVNIVNFVIITSKPYHIALFDDLPKRLAKEYRTTLLMHFDLIGFHQNMNN